MYYISYHPIFCTTKQQEHSQSQKAPKDRDDVVGGQDGTLDRTGQNRTEQDRTGQDRTEKTGTTALKFDGRWLELGSQQQSTGQQLAYEAMFFLLSHGYGCSLYYFHFPCLSACVDRMRAMPN